ncbi:MAG: 50S ribosomal protein L18e [Candidatus Micrarchaeaceae archaeon]
MKIEKDATKKWIASLEKSKENGNNANLSESAIFRSKKPRRQRVKVTLLKLEKYANNNDYIIIPGKVLGTGKITKKFNISAVEYSKSAIKKLEAAGCKIIDIESIMKNNNVRIIV